MMGRFILAMPRGEAGDCGEGEEDLAAAGCGAVPPLVGSRPVDAVLTDVLLTWVWWSLF